MRQDKLTKRESDIMEVLWGSSESLSPREIQDHIDDITMNTMQITIKKLLEKGFVVVDGVGFSRNALTRKYKPVISQTDYISKFFATGTARNITLHYVNTEASASELDELSALIQERLKQLSE